MSTYGASRNTVRILHHYMVVKIFRILGKARFCEICHIQKDIYGLRALKNKTKGTRSIKRKTVGSIGIIVCGVETLKPGCQVRNPRNSTFLCDFKLFNLIVSLFHNQ